MKERKLGNDIVRFPNTAANRPDILPLDVRLANHAQHAASTFLSAAGKVAADVLRVHHGDLVHDIFFIHQQVNEALQAHATVAEDNAVPARTLSFIWVVNDTGTHIFLGTPGYEVHGQRYTFEVQIDEVLSPEARHWSTDSFEMRFVWKEPVTEPVEVWIVSTYKGNAQPGCLLGPFKSMDIAQLATVPRYDLGDWDPGSWEIWGFQGDLSS